VTGRHVRTRPSGRSVEASSATQSHPKTGTVEVKPEGVAVVIVEFVFDLERADPAATRVTRHAGTTTYLQPDWGLHG
jgi:hypothetical protein